MPNCIPLNDVTLKFKHMYVTYLYKKRITPSELKETESTMILSIVLRIIVIYL